AYQGYGLGADRALIAALTSLLPIQPDLTMLLALDHATGAARVAARPGRLDRYEALDPAFHLRVADGFAAIAAAAPDRIRVIDAAGGIDTVHDRVWSVVQARLPC
ncbi:MAG: thymidylate kinase, partial [Pseudomonadota bacterium]|nr:thymidylate kinase [Pseudomonadota bacterium]